MFFTPTVPHRRGDQQDAVIVACGTPRRLELSACAPECGNAPAAAHGRLTADFAEGWGTLIDTGGKQWNFISFASYSRTERKSYW